MMRVEAIEQRLRELEGRVMQLETKTGIEQPINPYLCNRCGKRKEYEWGICPDCWAIQREAIEEERNERASHDR